jgi:hypothetical protein
MSVVKAAADETTTTLLPGAQFADTYDLIVDQPPSDAMAAARRALGRAPRWVRALLVLRTIAVMPFGLKSGGPRRGGECVGIFPVISRSPTRVVLGLDDRHLDFRIAVDLQTIGPQRGRIRVTTLVQTHNRLGRAYLATVLPFHRRIVPTMLAQAAHG